MIYKLQLFSTLLLAGLILTIQFIHYPLWNYVSKDKIRLFEKKHQMQITPLVTFLMILEACTAAYLLRGLKPLYIINFAALCGIWISTFLFQVPMHQKILQGVDVEKSIKQLIRTNYIRTFLWIFRAITLTFFA
jgi:hypothetical protein